jgi:hypothetical protein
MWYEKGGKSNSSTYSTIKTKQKYENEFKKNRTTKSKVIMGSIREGWGKGWTQKQDRKEETCKNKCTAKEYREVEKS